ncbi:MAG: hypothetical protein MMC23_000099 [Stictis urceolatum]|nr:hypothetical protein [Stictis urceolata]
MDLPFLDTKDANAFESPKFLCHKYAELSHLAVLCLAKVRMLLDLIALQDSVSNDKLVPKGIPGEILNAIQAHIVQSSIIGPDKEKINSTSHEARAGTLLDQVKMIFDAIKEANPSFWTSLLDDDLDVPSEEPEYYCRGTPSEVVHMLKFTSDAWTETPGALQVMRAFFDQ